MYSFDLTRRGIYTIAGVVLIFTQALGQGQSNQRVAPEPAWQRAAGGTMHFEVASVRPNATHSDLQSNVPLTEGPSFKTTGGTFTAVGPSLLSYILFAYKVGASESYASLVRSLPEWLLTDNYDIRAKSDNVNATKDQLRLMVQSLLEARFKLKVHREIREGDVNGLELLRPHATGPQLQPHSPTSPCLANGSTEPVNDPQVLRATPAMLLGVWPLTCGEGGMAYQADRVRAGGRDMTMVQIARWLTGTLDFDLPIQDRTGLAGTFDFLIDFAPERDDDASADAARSTPSRGAQDGRDALMSQLGLRVRKQRGEVTYFFVDHVERPSEN